MLAVLPTGYGKSLIFTLLPYAWNSLLSVQGQSVLVVSPLLSLMEDQVTKINTRGVPTVHVGTLGDKPPNSDTIKNIKDCKYLIVLLSPEAVFNDKWRSLLKSESYRCRVRTIVIDEAHCVIQWGKEFRCEYSRIGELRSLLPNATILALTASAPLSMRGSMANSLAMASYRTVQTSFDRPNIMYICIKAPQSIGETFTWLAEQLILEQDLCHKYIIYGRSIKSCALLFDFFSEKLGERAYVGVPGVRTRLFARFHRLTTCQEIHS